MPKLKTKSAIKKRFKMRGDGTLVHKKSHMRHNMRKKTQQQKRANKGFGELHASDIKCIMRCVPYGLSR